MESPYTNKRKQQRAANLTKKLLNARTELRFGKEIKVDHAQLLCTMPSKAQWLTREELASLLTGYDEDGCLLPGIDKKSRQNDRFTEPPWMFSVISEEAKRRGALLVLDPQIEVLSDFIDPITGERRYFVDSITVAYIRAYSQFVAAEAEPDPLKSGFMVGLALEDLNKARALEKNDAGPPLFLNLPRSPRISVAQPGRTYLGLEADKVDRQVKKQRLEAELRMARQAIDDGFDAYRLRRIAKK